MVDMDVFELNRTDLYELYDQYLNIERLGRLIAELVAINSEEHLFMLLNQTAETRYNTNYYKELVAKGEIAVNPRGVDKAFNSSNPYVKEKVIKGGSFLCSASYCASYRISARMATSPDSGMEHLGFRTILAVENE